MTALGFFCLMVDRIKSVPDKIHRRMRVLQMGGLLPHACSCMRDGNTFFTYGVQRRKGDVQCSSSYSIYQSYHQEAIVGTQYHAGQWWYEASFSAPSASVTVVFLCRWKRLVHCCHGRVQVKHSNSVPNHVKI